MPLRRLFIGVASVEDGGFVPQAADDLEADGKALRVGTTRNSQRRVAGSIESTQKARRSGAGIVFFPA